MKQKKICSSGGGGMEMCSALMVPAEPSPIPYLRRGGGEKKKGSDEKKKKSCNYQENHKKGHQLLGEKVLLTLRTSSHTSSYVLTCLVARHTFGLCFLGWQ